MILIGRRKVGCWVCVLLLSVQVCGQAKLVDLRQWGYRSSERAADQCWANLCSHTMSVAPNGDIIVGFVTRDRSGLSTRQLPPFSFHVLRLSKLGVLLSKADLPTPSWNNNTVYAGGDGTL